MNPARAKKLLNRMFKMMHTNLGPQHWWPGDTPLEIAVGAILTQNTSWTNVEKSIQCLKAQCLISEKRLHAIAPNRLASQLRSCGYYNIKTKRLKNFIRFLTQEKKTTVNGLKKFPLAQLRQELLSVNGIGPETADSILLYALDKPIFVVDAYTKRILSRHGIIKPDADYHDVQALFMRSVPRSARHYNEYHALLVAVGKHYCSTKKPSCDICPLGATSLR